MLTAVVDVKEHDEDIFESTPRDASILSRTVLAVRRGKSPLPETTH